MIPAAVAQIQFFPGRIHPIRSRHRPESEIIFNNSTLGNTPISPFPKFAPPAGGIGTIHLPGISYQRPGYLSLIFDSGVERKGAEMCEKQKLEETCQYRAPLKRLAKFRLRSARKQSTIPDSRALFIPQSTSPFSPSALTATGTRHKSPTKPPALSVPREHSPGPEQGPGRSKKTKSTQGFSFCPSELFVYASEKPHPCRRFGSS